MRSPFSFRRILAHLPRFATETIKAACKQYNDVDSTLPLPRTSAKAIRKKQKEAAPSTSKSAEFISASDDEDSSEEDKMEE